MNDRLGGGGIHLEAMPFRFFTKHCDLCGRGVWLEQGVIDVPCDQFLVKRNRGDTCGERMGRNVFRRFLDGQLDSFQVHDPVED